MDRAAGEYAEQSSLPAQRGPSGPPPHAAGVVASDAEVLAVAVPYLEEGLREGDLIALTCRPEIAHLLSDALDGLLHPVPNDPRLSLLGSRAPDVLVSCNAYLERAGETRNGRLRVLSAVDFGDDPADWREGQRFESVVNRLLDGDLVSTLCLYDRRYLPEPVIASAAATHPLLVDGGTWAASRHFQEPGDYVRSLPVPRESAEDVPPALVVEGATSLAGLRHTMGAVFERVVPDRDQRQDTLLAGAEIAANAFRHGRPPVSARVWADARTLVVTISDRGSGFADPLAGFQPAHGPDLGRGGMGLWLARKLFDHVDLLPGPDGLTVRLATRLR
ncbi:sensor histidine kinase [Blastococcus goldschmidtiae]|uniref:Sensor histidine kinase n=1 Tax=Blastococcus goldschmidtiae TaxID=3075546 RepID=A0ABU2K2F1_9ACTN|nr:sensor histidine kinase [Blastococcus sp. DSM 46792]MDT0274309.1 sensor histidine kinase [Blastococcus sp. DSM 46792]